MLGRLLEFSVATSDILESYEFYRSLGFTGIDGADIYPYRYGVVTDGRIAIGLHESDLPALSLTYVHPDLARHAQVLRGAGLKLSYEHLSDERFHELGIDWADGPALRLLEARTFSPVEPAPATKAGWFEELAVTVRDLPAITAHWERLGFVRVSDDGAWSSMTSDHLSMSLQAGSRAARPALRFSIDDVESTRAELEALGLPCDARVPLPPGADGALALLAPEGTPLLLVQAER